LIAFFNKLRSEAGGAALAASAAPQRLTRHSSGMGEFLRRIKDQEGLRVLDLGPTSSKNITFFTAQGNSIHNEDLLLESTLPAYVVRTPEGGRAIDQERFWEENLKLQQDSVDAVLCWDIPDYLEESLVKPFVERLHSITRPGGVLLAYFHTRDAGPEAPYYRYHVGTADSVDLQRGPNFRLQRVFNNRHIENLFKDFASIKFFLSRDHIREVLVIR
jgi:SAM-dependent methyltransferase